MAGLESARHHLWGASAVRRRGAVFLPRLASGDLWVEPMDLGAFVEEVDRLLADVNALPTKSGRRGDVLEHYLRNFLRAAEYARRRHGGICIT